MSLAYYFYDAAHLMLAPARAANDAARLLFNNPVNPLTYTEYGRTVSAACELFERTTRRYGKPTFNFGSTVVDGQRVEVTERVVWSKPFCQVISFDRAATARPRRHPKLLIVAPLSGHYATLLRGTVEAFLPNHQVYITDWADGSMVPLTEGSFDLDTYIDYLVDIFHKLGPDLHVLAVCQPSVPVISAVALMEAEDNPDLPLSITIMGGPIDTRRSPTEVNLLAEKRGVAWFERHCILRVPPSHPGFWRKVYPGFLQLSGFMGMNLERHLTAHHDMYKHLVRGDGDSAEKHREFYDEYLAVMDLPAEYFLQTVRQVFVEHQLPKGVMKHRDRPIDLRAIRRCAIMAVEGEKDDISGVGQTLAALQLTPNLPVEKKVYHLQMGVGHYGVFNGSRFKSEIAPRVSDFILTHQMASGQGAAAQPAPPPAASTSPPRLRAVV